MKKGFVYETSLGKVLIAECAGNITDIAVLQEGLLPDILIEETDLIYQASLQLQDYLRGVRKEFDLPLNPQGTEFQRKVWNILKNIPYGITWSYKQVATALGNPLASRAVGMANNKNPIMIVIPCHRVVGSDGSLVGYGGGLPLKQQLLEIEGCGRE